MNGNFGLRRHPARSSICRRIPFFVATFASYVTIDLARRVSRGGPSRRLWWLGGAFAMGTGVWSMHFVGMLGFDAGLPLAYRSTATFLSWIAAVVAAAIAFEIAAKPRLTPLMLTLGSASMAAGICTMHYLGMSAVDLAPGIVWSVPLVIASVIIAWTASAAALLIFFGLRDQVGMRRIHCQAVCSTVMGAAVGGMHYTAMAAAQIPFGAVCLSRDGLAGSSLAALVTIASLLILGGVLLLSVIAAMSHARETRLTASLHQAKTDLRFANDTLQKMAFQDALTGLPNRGLLEDRLRHSVSRVARKSRAGASIGQERVAVLLLNLDGFKPINDSFGHAVGDAVLCEIGQRLRHAVHEGDTLARLGADEFVVMLETTDAETVAVALSQRIIGALRRPMMLAGREIGVSCSIGVAVFPEHDSSGNRLIGCADAAMYTAKRAGGNTCVVYDESMGSDASDQLLLHQALRNALERNELLLFYQPKVSALDGQIHGLEALIRWQHPERGLVSPAVFIPLAERFGLINSIGDWVVEEACAQLARWQRNGLTCRVAVNLSPYQLRHPGLPIRIKDSLERHGIRPDQLVCEVTETALMENLHSETDVLERIVSLGVRLSIDDFGTGYSSLAHLRTIPARQLKIDRSFVVDVAENSDARAVLEAIVRLAHALRMEVVAEGVETATQQAALTQLGCDVLQGFAIAKPMPAAAVESWLNTSSALLRRSGTRQYEVSAIGQSEPQAMIGWSQCLQAKR